MERAAVQQAIQELEAEGTPMSIRAIAAKIGGSFRDISAWLKELFPGEALLVPPTQAT